MLARDVAASILQIADMKELERDPRFAFVQFHPSYNYEDFVRGIRVETDDDNNVVYKTENRTFGEMAKRAAASDDPHVLVIDEINRANVSAVLGELIYGLEMEYRGQEVQTPYEVGGKTGLFVPENLQIIGTMNTADRTIGQIDYAVRRRFAFVHCPPQRSVLKNKTAEKFFDLVDGVFAHLSADYDKEDVCIGHSYFLADGVELANKIIYQVVPILREYLKDGVLVKGAESVIMEIESQARQIKSASVPTKAGNSRNPGSWRWTDTKSGKTSNLDSKRGTVLSLVTHYATMHGCKNLDELREAFPNGIRPGWFVVRNADDERVQKSPLRFFAADEQIIHLEDESVVVCGEWASTDKSFDKFQKRARELGYEIVRVSDIPYCFVNIGEGNHRNWDDCRKYGFLSAGQGKHYSDQLKKLREGEVVFACISRKNSEHKGFVGFGEIIGRACPIRDARIFGGKENGKLLLDGNLKAQYPDKNKDNDDLCEWIVPVRWIKTFPRDNAVEGKGNRNTVWRKSDPKTLHNLEVGFGIKEADE